MTPTGGALPASAQALLMNLAQSSMSVMTFRRLAPLSESSQVRPYPSLPLTFGSTTTYPASTKSCQVALKPGNACDSGPPWNTTTTGQGSAVRVAQAEGRRTNIG